MPAQTREPNSESINTISTLLNAPQLIDQFPEISLRWQQLLARANVYSHLTGYKSFTKSWLMNKTTRWHINEIRLGLEALQELMDSHELGPEKKAELEWEIRRAIETELSFLEIRQYRKLINDQDIYRPEVLLLQDSLRMKVDLLRCELKKRKQSTLFTANLSPNLRTFFRKNERSFIDFEKAIFITQATGDVVGTMSSTITIGRFIPLQIVKMIDPRILFTIPALSGIIAAIPLLVSAIQSFVENRNTKKKILDTALTTVVLVGISIAISTPATVPLISGTFITVSILKDYLRPVISLFITQTRKRRELTSLQEKIRLTESDNTPPESIHLDQRDQSALLRRLEEYCASHPVPPAQIEIARELIITKNVSIDTLIKNPLIQLATKTQNGVEFKDFLLEEMDKHQNRLKLDISDLKAQAPKKIALALNGMVTIAGCILFCIPTPLTMLIGACLLASSYAMNIVIKYDYVPKLAGIIKKVASKEPLLESPPHALIKQNSCMRRLHRTLVQDAPPTDLSPNVKTPTIDRKSEEAKVQDIIDPTATPSLRPAFS